MLPNANADKILIKSSFDDAVLFSVLLLSFVPATAASTLSADFAYFSTCLTSFTSCLAGACTVVRPEVNTVVAVGCGATTN